MSKREYIISTDATSDMSAEYIEENNVNLIDMTYSFNGEEYTTRGEKTLPLKDFYYKCANEDVPKTSQVPVDTARKIFESYVKQGLDVFHLCFSSALSGTYQSCSIAANLVMEQYPEAKIVVVDSLSASGGHGLLLNYAVNRKKAGLSVEELGVDVESNIQHFCHYFTVSDLNYLHKGGRVSKLSAVVGSALGIKPILHVSEEGKLIPIGKVRGRKQALIELADKMESKYVKNNGNPVYIFHGDSLEDAEFLASVIEKKFALKNIRIGEIGPIIGAHSGPGTIALFFYGKDRIE